MSSSITITNLSLKYGQKQIFDNCSLVVPDVSITVVVGKSGNGKSSLLKAILGLISYRGEIDKKGKKLSYMPQDLALFDNQSVIENVSLPFHLTNREVDMNAVLSALQELEIIEKKDSLVKDLSGGQRSRVALARALVLESEVLLLDEPLSSLDYITKQNVLTLIKQIQREHQITILYVTHDIEEALKLADQILVVNGGFQLYAKNEVTRERLISLITN